MPAITFKLFKSVEVYVFSLLTCLYKPKYALTVMISQYTIFN